MDYKSVVSEIYSILSVNFIFTRTEGLKLVSGTYRVQGKQTGICCPGWYPFLFNSFPFDIASIPGFFLHAGNVLQNFYLL